MQILMLLFMKSCARSLFLYCCAKYKILLCLAIVFYACALLITAIYAGCICLAILLSAQLGNYGVRSPTHCLVWRTRPFQEGEGIAGLVEEYFISKVTHNIMGLFYVKSSVTIWVLFMCYLI